MLYEVGKPDTNATGTNIEWMDGYLATHTKRLGARSVPQVLIASDHRIYNDPISMLVVLISGI